MIDNFAAMTFAAVNVPGPSPATPLLVTPTEAWSAIAALLAFAAVALWLLHHEPRRSKSDNSTYYRKAA